MNDRAQAIEVQRTAEPTLDAPSPAGHATHFAESKGEERDDAIRLAPFPALEGEGGCFQERHAAVSITNPSLPASRMDTAILDTRGVALLAPPAAICYSALPSTRGISCTFQAYNLPCDCWPSSYAPSRWPDVKPIRIRIARN